MRSLILSPLSEISDSNAHQLGLRVYAIIAKAHGVMEQERRTLAAVPPGLSLPPCPSCTVAQHVLQCKDAWARFWWQKVARQLLRPITPLSLSAVMEYVASQPHIVGLNEQCKEEIIGQVVESGGLNVEEEIIGGAVLQLFSNTIV